MAHSQLLVIMPAHNEHWVLSVPSMRYAAHIADFGLERNPAAAVQKYAKADVMTKPATFARKTHVPPTVAIARSADAAIFDPATPTEVYERDRREEVNLRAYLEQTYTGSHAYRPIQVRLQQYDIFRRL